MYYAGRSAGLMYVILGGILFFFAAGDLVIRFLFALLALSLVNYGLRLLGRAPVHVVVYSWLDRFTL